MHWYNSWAVTFCVFHRRIYLNSKTQLYPVISVEPTASHHLANETWQVRNSLSSPFSFLFPPHTLLSTQSMTLWRQCTLLPRRQPPTRHGTLRLCQDSITLRGLNTSPESPSLSTQARTSSSRRPRKTITHPHLIPLQPTEVGPGLHTTTNLPLWSFSRLAYEGNSREFKAKMNTV